MIPSFLQPRFTMISSSVTWWIFPSTMSPPRGNLSDFSMSSIKSAIESSSLLLVMLSLILEITSLIMHAGVDAPAATPILLHKLSSFNGKSCLFSTKNDLRQFFSAMSKSFLELELLRSPIITMASTSPASLRQLVCLSPVAWQMVLLTSVSMPFSLMASMISSKSSLRKVVCATTK